jgi:hypothetical protein
MKIPVAIVGGLLLVSSAHAASRLDGVWKADPKATKYDDRPEFLLLKDGIYECRACTPPIRLPADGQPHPTPDRDYADAMSVTVVDDRTMRVASYKDGKMYAEFTRTLSADGNVMTTVARSSNNPTGEWKTSTSQLKRVGPAPAGAYAQSGYWSPVITAASTPANGGIVITLKVGTDRITFSDNDNASYTAVFGGPAVAVVGDASGGTVTVRRLSKTSFEERDFIKGKPSAINTFTLTNATTLTIVSRNLRSGYTDTFVLRKQ